MNKLTIRMLAKELGLSVSTISKAIRDSHEISTNTKKRVHALAEKLNYVPNHYASSLRRKNSKTIGVVIPEVVDSFFAQAINGIEAVAEEKGFHVLIYLSHENFARERMILKDFEGGRVDGVLMSVSRETPDAAHVNELMSMGVPLVFFDRVMPEVATAQVTTDDYESGLLATRHLLNNGCRQILFLSFSDSLSIAKRRLAGYRDAIAANGLKAHQKNVLAFTNDARRDHLLLKRILRSPKAPDGILASVEKLAITVYQVCEELQMRIPEDVRVISFSNLETAAFLNPPLTTIAQPAFEMGRTAASVLMKALGKKKMELLQEEIVIPSSLVVRRSSAAR